jgi:hypothetical protein
MNEHDEDIAQLFSRAELPLRDAEFMEESKLRLTRERRRQRLRHGLGIAAIVMTIASIAFLVPIGSLYPLWLAQEFLSSGAGAMACAACALALTVWLRWSED